MSLWQWLEIQEVSREEPVDPYSHLKQKDSNCPLHKEFYYLLNITTKNQLIKKQQEKFCK